MYSHMCRRKRKNLASIAEIHEQLAEKENVSPEENLPELDDLIGGLGADVFADIDKEMSQETESMPTPATPLAPASQLDLARRIQINQKRAAALRRKRQRERRQAAK